MRRAGALCYVLSLRAPTGLRSNGACESSCRLAGSSALCGRRPPAAFSRRTGAHALIASAGGSVGGLIPRADLIARAKHHKLDMHLVERVADVAERTIREFTPMATPFLPPLEGAELLSAFESFADVRVEAVGGLPQAERTRLVLWPVELAADDERPPESLAEHFLALVEVSGNFLFDPARHGDFLGAITKAAGVKREHIGDIVVLGDRGAQVIVDPDIVEALQTFLNKVRTVPVSVRPVRWSELQVQPPRLKEVTTVEKSLRVDAVGSAGFGISRNKMNDAIRSGNVRVNWREVHSASATVKAGDIINLQGKGRVVVGDVSTTAKSKYRVQLSRYT